MRKFGKVTEHGYEPEHSIHFLVPNQIVEIIEQFGENVMIYRVMGVNENGIIVEQFLMEDDLYDVEVL